MGAQQVNAEPVSLTGSGGWGAVQDLIVAVCVALLVLFFAPPLLWRYIAERRKP